MQHFPSEGNLCHLRRLNLIRLYQRPQPAQRTGHHRLAPYASFNSASQRRINRFSYRRRHLSRGRSPTYQFPVTPYSRGVLLQRVAQKRVVLQGVSLSGGAFIIGGQPCQQTAAVGPQKEPLIPLGPPFQQPRQKRPPPTEARRKESLVERGGGWRISAMGLFVGVARSGFYLPEPPLPSQSLRGDMLPGPRCLDTTAPVVARRASGLPLVCPTRQQRPHAKQDCQTIVLMSACSCPLCC